MLLGVLWDRANRCRGGSDKIAHGALLHKAGATALGAESENMSLVMDGISLFIIHFHVANGVLTKSIGTKITIHPRLTD